MYCILTENNRAFQQRLATSTGLLLTRKQHTEYTLIKLDKKLQHLYGHTAVVLVCFTKILALLQLLQQVYALQVTMIPHTARCLA